MMQLATIASFVVLLCGLFGTTTVANGDQNTMTGYDAATSVKDLSNSCIFGTESVSLALYTSGSTKRTLIQGNESCNLLDTSKPVFFMIQGFIADSFNYHFSDFASQLLEKGYTAFSFDWNNASCYDDPVYMNLLHHPDVANNTRKVGNYLARYVKTVIDDCRVPLKNITLIGDGLGAHISSFAAKKLKNWNYTIPLLIGSDPMDFEITKADCSERFCKNDAERVVALHTSLWGIRESLGHLDLWFNNGHNQPGCYGWHMQVENARCSHKRGILYVRDIMLYNTEYVGVSIPAVEDSSWPRVVPTCSLDRSDRIVIDKRIFDSNDITTGDYCVGLLHWPQTVYCIPSLEHPTCQK